MKYSATFLDYFLNTRHAGLLEGDDVLSSSHRGRQDCFDSLVLSIRVDNGHVVAAAFRCATTPALISALEYICRWLEGQSLSAIPSLQPQQILQELQLDRTYIHIADLVCTVVGALRHGN